MYKDGRYINAGTNEFYRYGHKAQEMVKAALTPNKAGYYSIPTDTDKYWTIGTSDGKYGEFASINGTIFSVNSRGNAYAKAGTEKGEKFVEAITAFLNAMIETNKARAAAEEED